MTPERLEALSRRFQQFARLECHGSSPLYEHLSLAIASDTAILELAGHCRKGQPVPNLFFAAVHFLLLTGVRHRLTSFYPSVSALAVPDDDPYPHFRAFCLENKDRITALISSNLVQTNVIRRCACLLPALGIIFRRTGLPLSLVEIGTSAGLNLLLDRYGYSYGDGQRYGDLASPVQVTCELKGCQTPPVPEPFPLVAWRAGIDLNPIDVSSTEAVMWLRALIWPEHRERMEMQDRAIELAQRHRPSLFAGDALELLPDVI